MDGTRNYGMTFLTNLTRLNIFISVCNCRFKLRVNISAESENATFK